MSSNTSELMRMALGLAQSQLSNYKKVSGNTNSLLQAKTIQMAAKPAQAASTNK